MLDVASRPPKVGDVVWVRTSRGVVVDGTVIRALPADYALVRTEPQSGRTENFCAVFDTGARRRDVDTWSWERPADAR